MPDADIPPIVLTEEEVSEIQSKMPALPSFYRNAWKDLGLDSTVINALLLSQPTAQLLQRVFDKSGDVATARRVSLWLLTVVSGQVDADGTILVYGESIPDDFYIDLSKMVDSNELSSTAAKEVFSEMISSAKDPRSIALAKNLIQVSDESAIIAIVDEVLSDPSSVKAVEDLKNGNDKVIGFLVGQVMKKSQGKANPALAQRLIRERVVLL